MSHWEEDMSNIKYVCLSDLHLGEEGSLLTNLKKAQNVPDPSKPSPVMTALANCLKDLLKDNHDTKPTLILNGDILELALCPINQAVQVFEHFVKLTMSPDNTLFSEIVFVPGNHDHHLWETARETQYINYIKTIPVEGKIDPAWHTSKLFMSPQDKKNIPSRFMSAIINRHPHLENFKVTTAYPNYGILSADEKRSVIFHHGHFVEPMYHLMSTLASELFPEYQMPEDVYKLEEENFAWIDFFWSTMGRSGEVGKGIERIYEKLQYKEGREELLETVSQSIARNINIPLVMERLEPAVIKKLLKYLTKDALAEHERQHARQVLSERATKGLWWYMEKMVHNQIMHEHQTMPEEGLTFVFGHTHKPFEEDMNFDGFKPWVNVLNTGGWVIGSYDPKEPSTVHGSSVVVIDENLNAANVRLYNEGKYEVYVNSPGQPGEEPNELTTQLSNTIDPTASPWKEFGQAVEHSVAVRASNRKTQIQHTIKR